MKRILLAIVMVCAAALPAAAQKTKAQLTTEIGTTYPDNTSGSITPSGVRAYETDLINSIMPTAPVVSGNIACFNGTTGLLQDCGSAPTTVPLTIGVTPVNSAVNGQVLYANGAFLGQYTNTQLTAQINTATGSSSGALPAWPNNTTTFYRGDGTYSGLNYAALPTISADNLLGNPTGGSATPQQVSVGNCSNALTYSTASHTFGCNSLAGTGTVTSVATSGILTGGPIATSGTLNVNATITPQGRLTLVSGQSVMQSSQAGATTVYYTPHYGNLIILYDGTNFVPTAFSEVSQATTDTTKSPAAVAASSCYDMFGWLDSGTFRVTRGPAWTNTTTRSAGTALVKVNGIWLNNASITNGPAAQRGTYAGSICSNSSSSIDYIFGGISVGATTGVFNVWNMYNRVPVYSMTGDSGGPVANTTTGWRPALNNSAMRTNFLVGMVADPVKARYDAYVGANSGTVAGANVGFNTTVTPCGPGSAATTSGFTIGPVSGSCVGYPTLGLNYLSAIEYNFSTTSATFSATGGGGSIQVGLVTELMQ